MKICIIGISPILTSSHIAPVLHSFLNFPIHARLARSTFAYTSNRLPQRVISSTTSNRGTRFWDRLSITLPMGRYVRIQLLLRLKPSPAVKVFLQPRLSYWSGWRVIGTFCIIWRAVGGNNQTCQSFSLASSFKVTTGGWLQVLKNGTKRGNNINW